MNSPRRSLIIYSLLAAVWVLIVGWQFEEHLRVREAARADLRNRSREIANTLSALIRGMRFRGTVLTERLEPALNELINGRANELVKSSELLSVTLLNAANESVASAGAPVDLRVFQQPGGERWGPSRVILINPVDLGARLTGEGATNPTVVLPPFHDFTNSAPDPFRGRSFNRRDPPPPPDVTSQDPDPAKPTNFAAAVPPPDGPGEPRESRRREFEGRPRRPPW